MNVHQIITCVSEGFSVPREVIVGPQRHRRYAIARQAAYWLAQRQGYSLPHIGDYIGHRDHTTVLHGIRATEKRLAEDEDFAHRMAVVRNWVEGLPVFMRHSGILRERGLIQ